MTMKMIFVIVTALTLLSWGCNTRFERYPVQGKWKIEQINYQFQNKRDSVVRSDFGYIIFDPYSQDDNEMVKCIGTRVYPNGEKATFYFRTMRDVYENERKRGIEMAGKGSAERVFNELWGRYFIEKLTDQEMILMCYNCGNLSELLTRFELRATKVPK